MANAEGQQIDTLPSQMYAWDGTKPIRITADSFGAPMAKIIDDVSTAGMTYIGTAPSGALTSGAVWSIRRIDESGSPNTVVVKWANSGSFISIWDNRVSLTYA